MVYTKKREREKNFLPPYVKTYLFFMNTWVLHKKSRETERHCTSFRITLLSSREITFQSWIIWERLFLEKGSTYQPITTHQTVRWQKQKIHTIVNRNVNPVILHYEKFPLPWVSHNFIRITSLYLYQTV